MTALLFALVDGLWLHRVGGWRYWRQARRRLGMRELVGPAGVEFRKAVAMLGWWRSLWSLGGGA